VIRDIHVLLLILAFALSGCQTMFTQDTRLASAEPLFGQDLDHCLDDPRFMISLMAKGPAEFEVGDPKAEKCKNLSDLFDSYLFTGNDKNHFSSDASSVIRRNEVIQALIGISNRKCGRYSAHIKTFDGQSNSLLSVLAIATGGLGGIATTERAARLLAGTSAVASGSRVAINDAWFSNQTIQVLVAGYEKERSDQLRAIQQRQMCPIKYYPTMAGIADAMQYHASCSLITGLSAAAQAIESSDQPAVDVVRRQLTEIAAIRRQADLVVSGLNPESSSATLQIESDLTSADGRIQQLENSLLAAAQKLSTPTLAADGLTPVYPDAIATAAIQNQIKELEKQKKEAERLRAGIVDKLNTAKATDITTRSSGALNITQSQSEFLQCPLGRDKAE
jgi:hypothetical protein